MSSGTKDISWQESQVHQKNISDLSGTDTRSVLDHSDHNHDYDTTAFQLFTSEQDQKELFETFEYHLPLIDYSSCAVNATVDQNQIRVIKLRGQAEINNSTGLSIWLGSEVLSQFLLQNTHLIFNQQVLELGAGLGLCSITSFYIGAKRVIATDGDTSVLNILRSNVESNIDSINVDTTRIISCPQHIWGQNIQQFIHTHGKSNVILATDCVYIPQSLHAFWTSIDQLLVGSPKNNNCDDNYSEIQQKQTQEEEERKHEGIFIYTNRCSSGVPIEKVLQMATKFGFVWTAFSPISSKCYSLNHNSDGDETYVIDNQDNDTKQQPQQEEKLEDKIFIFTRGMNKKWS